MVSCKKLSGSASRTLYLPLLHHVRLQRKTLPSVVSRVRFSLSQRRRRRFAPSTASETPTVFCLRRKTRWTWSSCLHEQAAQEQAEESRTFVVPISLNSDRLTWTSDTTFFPRSSHLQLHARRIQCSDEDAQQYVHSHFAYTILVVSSDWMTVNVFSKRNSWSMEWCIKSAFQL